MNLIPNDWKHLLRTETCQKSLLKILCYNYKVTRKVKDFQKFSNKEIYFTLQSYGTTKYNKPFKFISWPNFLERHHILSPDICAKAFTDWFKKCAGGYIFSIWYKLIHFSLPLNLAIQRMDNAPKILCPRCKDQEESQPYFIFHCKLSKITLNFISELITLKYVFNIPFKIIVKTS